MLRKSQKIIVLLSIWLLSFSAFSSITVAGEKGIGQLKKDAFTLEDIHNIAKNEVSGEQALSNVAYPYLGWRTNGGPWFNAVLEWLAIQLENMGLNLGMETAGDKYWVQEDVVGGGIWDPKYASLEIVGPEGDEGVFDFILNTFDPTSDYYPNGITYDWVMANIGSDEEALINERCHLARRSGFTDPIGTIPDEAVGITAEVVYVGEVFRAGGKYVWTENTDADLTGKIIFATNSRSRAYRLALQEGAVVSLCSQINAYNNPIIDGEELYPNTVKYASVSNSSPNPNAPLAFNLSPQDERYLINLLGSAAEPIFMKAVAIGDYYPYSDDKPLKTLIAEIEGDARPDERVVFIAHVQEPGANDNASGVGLQLEVVRTLKKLIEEGQLPRPDRTMTFIWGAEYTGSYLWQDAHSDQMPNVVAALVLDMVGEDPEKTGGIMRIEKTPDPSAVYNYGLDLLPGQEEPPMTDAFVRQPDKHTLWGAGGLEYQPYPGFFINDLYYKSASLVSGDFTVFQVGSNPWEGGSDHDTFLWYDDPIPALLSWHFTDYVYHSSMDTMGTVSQDELRYVGITTINVGYLIANSGEQEAAEIMDIVNDRTHWRFDWEMINSEGNLNWAYDKAEAEGNDPQMAVADALELELEILNAWGLWYQDALESASRLCDPTLSGGYTKLESKYIKDIDHLIEDAVEKAEKIARKLSK